MKVAPARSLQLQLLEVLVDTTDPPQMLNTDTSTPRLARSSSSVCRYARRVPRLR